ncbi:MAG: hypothetical protein ACFB10_08655 [Salibacteraceae bacterium]
MNLSKKLGWVLLLCLTVWACRKDDSNITGIPLVNVNIQLFTNDPAFINLQVPGGFDYITGGSRGIVVYRLSNDQFMAYDRHCPYQVEDACQVAVDSSGVILEDACCGSRYIITDGSVVRGPSAAQLQMYQTEFNGSVLRIFN